MTGKEKEDMVFSQNISEEELEAVSGGGTPSNLCEASMHRDCSSVHYHPIYDPSFPSCVKTVEDGSWCSSADACFANSIEYTGMKDCSKAWK